MSKKKLSALILLLIGIACIILSFYVSNRVNTARGQIRSSSKALPSNPFVNAFTDAARNETNKYNGLIRWSLIGGIVLGVAGGSMLYYYCRRK